MNPSNYSFFFDHPAPQYIPLMWLVWEFKSSPLMFYLCILQPPGSPPFSFLCLIFPVFQDKGELSVAVELQTGCHGDCQRLCVSVGCVCVCVSVSMCMSHAILKALSNPGRLTVSCLGYCWWQIDHCCCRPVVRSSVKACYMKWFKPLLLHLFVLSVVCWYSAT